MVIGCSATVILHISGLKFLFMVVARRVIETFGFCMDNCSVFILYIKL